MPKAKTKIYGRKILVGAFMRQLKKNESFARAVYTLVLEDSFPGDLAIDISQFVEAFHEGLLSYEVGYDLDTPSDIYHTCGQVYERLMIQTGRKRIVLTPHHLLDSELRDVWITETLEGFERKLQISALSGLQALEKYAKIADAQKWAPIRHRLTALANL